MKIIGRILQTTTFIAMFVAGSFALLHTIAPGSCKRVYIGAIGWSIPLVLGALAIGFGAVARGELSRRTNLWLWSFAALYFGVQSRLVSFYDYSTYSKKFTDITEVFVPDLQLGYAIEATAPFFGDVVRYWMPFAAAISILAFLLSWFTLPKQLNKKAEQVGAGDAEEAV